ncbi:VPA1262 family N-terminal domain-containing protein [Sporomusa sp. GT1]|uniref:VPA1262 family N-terminal domain-containing protein n=1 Tax=Sporomusa sp. GT1 TaxID=1534747 RepID=UPI00166C1385|nr:VPA1262 family N-terminal domain-containing protein [Sporomusa sp. GT1]
MKRIQIFAAGKKDTFDNVFTLIRSVDEIYQQEMWKQISGSKSLKLFEAYLTDDRFAVFIDTIETKGEYSIDIGEVPKLIKFGQFRKRPEVFLPHIPASSTGSEWWPGTLNHGFSLKQWYRNGFKVLTANEEALDKLFTFIRSRTGITIEKLQDFLGCMISLSSSFDTQPRICYNPDNGKIVFYLPDGVAPSKRRVVIEAWEGKECCYKQMIDLTEEKDWVAIDIPFKSVQLGYELYEKNQDENWVIIAANRNYLMRRIQIDMGLVVGKLNVKKEADEEELDIVVRDNTINIGHEDGEQPWMDAEQTRYKINRGQELRSLGSIFTRFAEKTSKEKLRQIINDHIYKNAVKELWIWDPYIDISILSPLLVLGLTNPSLDVRLLLSECSGERLNPADEASSSSNAPSTGRGGQIEDILDTMTRCSAIYKKLHTREAGMQRLKETKNFSVRNWFRSGKHAFHDRFIITENAVWQIGSSLKDLGDYHSTVYRLEGDIADAIRGEFERAWNGNFDPMNPDGMEVFPELHWIKRKEGTVNV